MRSKACRVGVGLLAVASWTGPVLAEADWWDDHGAMGCLHCRRVAEALADAPAAAFDEATGRDLRNYPPSRHVDYQHMRLAITIPDMETPRFDATQELTFTPIAGPVTSIELNAEQLEIKSVSGGTPMADASPEVASFDHDGSVLTITFDRPLAADMHSVVKIEYSVTDPPEGLFWTTSDEAWPDRAPQIHTQGQPETNRYWFPAHDSPNERMTCEIIVAAPAGYDVSANGGLVARGEAPFEIDGLEYPPAGHDASGGEEPLEVWHWKLAENHVTYLTTLIVGKFAVEDVARAPRADIPQPVYAPAEWADRIEGTYRNTSEMIRVFEERFDEPYPWERYAQLVVWNFGSGGMENTSATTMFDTAVLDDIALADSDLDGLISHELAHQWFGDLITCRSWAHIWLNEGWATYSTGLWYEARDGWDEYLAYIYGRGRGVAEGDRVPSGNDRPGMVSPIYEHPWHVFRRASNPYPKGAAILHMLREKLGEEVFFEAVAEYVDRYKFGVAETADFRKVLEDVSGLGLERFFWQWCERPGTPALDVRVRWDEAASELMVSVEQTQHIDSDNPAFVFDLPIEIGGADSGDVRTITIPVDSRRHERAITLDSKPTYVAIDPRLTVLCTLDVSAPTDMLIAQLDAPSIASRIDAARLLGDRPGEKAAEALAGVLMNTSASEHVRTRAAESLGSIRAEEKLLAAMEDGVSDPRVRRSVIKAIGTIGGEDALAVLRRHAGGEERSYAARAAAIDGLARWAEAGEIPDEVMAALEFESQHDQVRTAALRALREFDTPESLNAAIPYTKLGHLQRTRPVAIDTVAAHAEHDRDRAYETVAPLLYDPEERTARAAIGALVEIGHEDGLGALERYASSTRHPEWREDALDAADRLRGVLARERSGERVRGELEKLRRELDALKAKVEQRGADDKD